MSWYTDEQVVETIKYYMEGHSRRETAEKAGITPETVIAWLKKAGVSIRREDAPLKRNWSGIRESLDRIEAKLNKENV